MTLQNRVTPDGRIIADAARGAMMGNRGILHDAERRLGAARWQHANWVACRLSFNGRHRQIMTPGRYTELFFLDEAVAFAAGHRPCGECRHADYRRFKALWEQTHGEESVRARDIDRTLHAERAVPRRACQRRHVGALASLPDGAFVILPETPQKPYLVLGAKLFPYAPAGYGAAVARPRDGEVAVLTPPGTLAVFRAGYQPMLCASAVSD